MSERSKFLNVLNLRLPKFSKGYSYKDFHDTFHPLVAPESVILGRLKYPNEWTMTVQSFDTTKKLLRRGSVIIKKKKCLITPFEASEVCGRIHWMPSTVSDNELIKILKRFGHVTHFEQEKIEIDEHNISTAVRFFVMSLNTGIKRDEIPHYINVNECEGLVTIRGREPICFQCKLFGHRKKECPSTVSLEKRQEMRRAKKVKYMQFRKQSNAVVPENNVTNKGAAAALRMRRNKPTTKGSNKPISSDAHNLSGVVCEVNNLQNMVNIFSKKLVDVLSSVSESVAESQPSTSSSTAAKKSKKKKKKNTKASENKDKEVPPAQPNEAAKSSVVHMSEVKNLQNRESSNSTKAIKNRPTSGDRVHPLEDDGSKANGKKVSPTSNPVVAESDINTGEPSTNKKKNRKKKKKASNTISGLVAK